MVGRNGHFTLSAMLLFLIYLNLSVDYCNPPKALLKFHITPWFWMGLIQQELVIISVKIHNIIEAPFFHFSQFKIMHVSTSSSHKSITNMLKCHAYCT